MKDKLNRLDTILNELQMDEYLNKDSLPKIGEARGLVNELVKNCSIPDVSNWVAISEPPKKDGKYLVYIQEVDLVMIGEWKEDCFHGNGTLPICTVVTHWQELPKPPCC